MCMIYSILSRHLGAGYHSPTNSDLYKQICKQACLQVSTLAHNCSVLILVKVQQTRNADDLEAELRLQMYMFSGDQTAEGKEARFGCCKGRYNGTGGFSVD